MNGKRRAPRHIKENEKSKTSRDVKNRSPSKEWESITTNTTIWQKAIEWKQQNLAGRIIFNLKFYTQGNYYSSMRVKYLFDMHGLKAFTPYNLQTVIYQWDGFTYCFFLFSNFPCTTCVINALCLLNEHPFPEEFKAEITPFSFPFPITCK